MPERNANCICHIGISFVYVAICNSTHSPNRTSGDTVPTTRTATTTNGYKNDLHIGKTVDILLFATRHKTDVSENHNDGKKMYTHDADGSEWSWNKEENYLTYMHRNGLVLVWVSASPMISEELMKLHLMFGMEMMAIVAMWMHLGIITHIRTRTLTKNGKRSDNKSHSQNYGLCLSLSLCVCRQICLWFAICTKQKKHILLEYTAGKKTPSTPGK